MAPGDMFKRQERSNLRLSRDTICARAHVLLFSISTTIKGKSP